MVSVEVGARGGPGELDALSRIIEAEGGEILAINYVAQAIVRWPTAVLTWDRWEEPEGTREWWHDPLAYRAEVLTRRVTNLFRRWLGQAAPRPRADDRWRDAELTFMAFTGEAVDRDTDDVDDIGRQLARARQLAMATTQLAMGRRWTWPRLRRPWQPPGSSLRKCAVCGASLEGRRPQARTCSDRCRQALRRGTGCTTTGDL